MFELIRRFQRQDVLLTALYLSNTPFHPNFWVHRRIKQSIAEHSHLAKGIMLDVGCGMKPYENVFKPYVEKYLGIEYKPESGYSGNRADFCADAAQLPLPDSSVDTILCTEVLEHVPNPEQVMSEFARVLRLDGIVMCTAPFFYPIHDEYDFFRYTSTGLSVMAERHNLTIKKVQPLCGTGMTLAILINIYLFDIGFMWTKWLYPIGVVLRPILWLLILIVNLGGWLAEKLLPSNQMAFNHLTIAQSNLNKPLQIEN